jgi:predicted phosphohydrolase
MKIQYNSDIHLELMNAREQDLFLQKWRKYPPADVLVLAGDIGNPFQDSYKKFLQICSETYPKVFLIAGNHEFYTNTIPETLDQIRRIVTEFPTISFLHNSSDLYQGILWIGTTLWSSIENPLHTINDTRVIQNFTVDDYKKLHTESVTFLNSFLASIKDPCILITHHLPLYQLIHPHYRTPAYEKYNQWFASRLDSLVESSAHCVKGWVYGHTHTGTVLNYYGVRFYCNPLGYQGESAEGLQYRIFET